MIKWIVNEFLPVIAYFVIRVLLVVLLIVVTILVIQWSGWLASWIVANWYGVKYNTVVKDSCVVFAICRYFIPAAFLILVSIIIRGYTTGTKIMGLRFKFRLWHILVIAACVPVFYFSSAWILQFVQHNFSQYMNTSWKHDFSWHSMSTHGKEWGYMFYSIVCAPIGEEVIFRGWLYGWLRKIFPSRWFIPIAIIISSVCFAWIHNLPKQAVISFVFGACLCILRQCTGNIYWGMAIHSLWNLHTFI